MHAEDIEKQTQEMVSNLAVLMSTNPGNIKKMSYNKARSPVGTENAERAAARAGARGAGAVAAGGDVPEAGGGAAEGEESPVVKDPAVPESFPLSPGEAVFYGPAADGTTEVVEYKELAEEDAA